MENESVDRIEKAEVAGEQEVKTGPSVMEPPMEDYDSLNVRQATERFDSISLEELERVRSYELEHKNRKTLIAELDKRLVAGEQQETVIEEPAARPAVEERQEPLMAEPTETPGVAEQQEPLTAEPVKGPADEKQQEGGMDESWFSAYRNWILAAVGAVVLLWLIF